MASGPYSFIDIAVMEEVRARFAAGDALVILTVDLDEVIWANGAGATLLGYTDIEAVMGGSPGFSSTARRQMASAQGFPRSVRNRTIAVRLATSLSSKAVNFQLNSLTLPHGEPAILLAVPAPAHEPGSGKDTAARIIDGFKEAGYFAALLDGQGQIAAASEGFSELAIEEGTLEILADEVSAETDRLVKRLIPAGHGRIPAGIARLVDEPPLNLLIAIAEIVSDAEPEEAPMPEPSDADLAERLEEDRAFEPAEHEGGLDVSVQAEPATPSLPADSVGSSEADDWYFGPDVFPERAEEQEADTPAIPDRPDFSDSMPLRFVWRTDAAGAFSFISSDFITLVRQHADNLIGNRFKDVAVELGLDPGGEISSLLDRRDTWSGRTVLWPIIGTDLLAPVDLAALPTYGRDRVFEGFRGFGVLRLAEAVVDPLALGMKPEQEKSATDNEPDAGETLHQEDPFRGEVPVISIAERRDRRASDKVIRLAERRPSPEPVQPLSVGERNALEEIRARLSEDFEAETLAGEEGAPADNADEHVPDTPSETAGSDFPEHGAPSPAMEDDHVSDPVAGSEANEETAASDNNGVDEPEKQSVAPSLGAEEHRIPVSDGFVPSAFATGKPGLTGSHAELISILPLPLLVHAGDELYFANREFLALTGYASIDQIRREGGLDRLFVETKPETTQEPEGRKLHLRTLGGDEFPVDAHLQSIRWDDGSALLLSVKRLDTAPATDLPAVAAPAATPDSVREMERRVAEMRTIIDTATDGVVLINSDRTIRTISRPAEALFGFDSADVEGNPFHSLFAIESQKAASDYLAGLAENGVASVLNDGREVIGREAEGRFIPLFMTIGRLPDESGYCAVVRDITQWKRAEEELTQARSHAERASSQKTEFLARVSHEIRTPLNAIIGFSELMMDEKFGPIGSDRYRDYLRDINRSGNHVLDLVNDLLDISKIEAGEQEMNYEAVSLNDALSESVAMMQPQANRDRVIIRSSLASRLPEVVADLRSVRQIALNLLSNAVRYTLAGGQVIVSTSYEPTGDVVMRVRDTGIGMTVSEIDQALKPFKQINALKRGRHDGTGLGLPLTKAMVEANRARFTIASTPGEGTLVEITFPSTRVLAD